MRHVRRMAAGVLCLVFLPASLFAQGQYRTADEAYRDGLNHLRAQRERESILPLEAALKLAPDVAYKKKVYEALQRGYRSLPEVDKFVEAGEFLVEHSDTQIQRWAASNTLLNFLVQRGQLDYAVERYEKKLQANVDDLVALAVLSKLYERPRKNPDRAAELATRLAGLEKHLARTRAEKLEQDAAAAPMLAGVYWKDAALAWLDAADKDRAKAAAEKALAAGPDVRNDLLGHFWHKAMGDVFLAVGEPKRAIPRYKAAIELTQIDGYLKDCRAMLAEAEAAANASP